MLVVVKVHGTATPTTAAVTGGEPSNPGVVGESSGVASSGAGEDVPGEGAAGAWTSSSAGEVAERACSSRQASKMALAMASAWASSGGWG